MYKLTISILLLATFHCFINSVQAAAAVERYQVENTALVVQADHVKTDETKAPDEHNKDDINENNDISSSFNVKDNKDANDENEKDEEGVEKEEDHGETGDKEEKGDEELLLRAGNWYVRSDVKPASDLDLASQDNNEVGKEKDDDGDEDEVDDEEDDKEEEDEEEGDEEDDTEEDEGEDETEEEGEDVDIEVSDNNDPQAKDERLEEIIVSSLASTQSTIFLILAISSCILLVICLGCLIVAVVKKMRVHPPSQALILRKGGNSENV